MTKISTLSDQPFSFSPKNVIFGVKIMKFLIQGQNFGIFASSIKGMDTFLFEMSMKWMFTFKNFRNVYWHGKQHSACSAFIHQCDCPVDITPSNLDPISPNFKILSNLSFQILTKIIFNISNKLQLTNIDQT